MSPAAPTERTSSAPTFAVVMKTYAWDAFIKRQAQRWAASATNGDFFISYDETGNRFRNNSAPDIVRTSQKALLSMGLANRFEAGSLLWWNADYAHYQFLDQFPGYDYYAFVEYDALFTGDLLALVTRLASTNIDFAAFPLRQSKTHWPWTTPHLAVYSLEEVEGCLMCISVFSRRALEMLYRRRLEMSKQEDLRYWPSAEVFLPTEIKRAGYTALSLESFGDTTRFNWRPACLEELALLGPSPAFFHPLYDRKRYVRWTVKEATLRSINDANGPALAPLSHLSKRSYFPVYANAAARLLWKTITHRLTY